MTRNNVPVDNVSQCPIFVTEKPTAVTTWTSCSVIVIIIIYLFNNIRYILYYR